MPMIQIRGWSYARARRPISGRHMILGDNSSDHRQHTATDPLAPGTGISVHRSATIASACYVGGLAFDLYEAPAMLNDLITGCTADWLLAGSFAAFLVFAAFVQWHMGIAPWSHATVTPDNLCTTGPFAASRNPVYLAFLGPLAALGCWSIIASTLAATVYILAMSYLVVDLEETFLLSKFGDAYAAYIRQTPRWLFV